MRYEALRAYALGASFPGGTLPLGLAHFQRRGMAAWLLADFRTSPLDLERTAPVHRDAGAEPSELVRLLAGMLLPFGRRAAV